VPTPSATAGRRHSRTVAAALSEHLVSPSSTFTLPYGIQVADRVIHDAEERGTETMSVAQILSRSSNVSAITLAQLLGKLSDVYRANCRSRGMADPGHVVLEGVLVVSAAFTLTVFVVWFLFFAGADPIPIGIQI